MIRQWLRTLLPHASIVDATFGRLPVSLLLGRHRLNDARLQSRDHLAAGDEATAIDRRHAARYALWNWTAREPIEEAAFRRWAATVNDKVLRAKGILFRKEDLTHQFVFQLVRGHWSLRRDSRWPRMMPRSQGTVIGYRDQLDPDLLGASIGEHLACSITRVDGDSRFWPVAQAQHMPRLPRKLPAEHPTRAPDRDHCREDD
jgi:G3E family GTPase